MIVGEDGHVGGSINRAALAGLLAGTDDEELKAYYRELLGDSDEGAAADAAPSSEAELEAPADTDLDELRAQAEALGVKVDGRWGEQRLRDEIASYDPEE